MTSSGAVRIQPRSRFPHVDAAIQATGIAEPSRDPLRMSGPPWVDVPSHPGAARPPTQPGGALIRCGDERYSIARTVEK